MSFCLGIVRDHWALVAADTRTCWKAYADDDPEAWAAPVVQTTDGSAKICALPTGWLVSGPSAQWRNDAAHAARQATTLPALLAAYRAFAGPAMAALEADCPADARIIRERQGTIVVVRDGDGFAGAHFGSAGELVFPHCRGVTAICPDVPRPVMQQLLDSYQVAVEHERDLRRVVQATAQLYAAVYSQTGPDGSVSGDVAIGLIDARGPRLIGPLPHAELLAEEVPC